MGVGGVGEGRLRSSSVVVQIGWHRGEAEINKLGKAVNKTRDVDHLTTADAAGAAVECLVARGGAASQPRLHHKPGMSSVREVSKDGNTHAHTHSGVSLHNLACGHTNHRRA